MKKILLLSLITCAIIHAEEEQPNPMQQTFESFRNNKAFQAIIHDTYKEAMPMENVPEAYTNAVKKMGLSSDDVKFYTAVRMDRFVEKAGNCVVLLRPNFFLYLTEEEQVANIAVQLSRIKAGDLSEMRTYNQTQKNLERVDMAAKTAIAGALAFHYRDALINAVKVGMPHVKNLVCSKTGAFIGACVVATACAHMAHTRKKNQELTEHELSVIDAMGPDELIKIRERQVIWGKNGSWLRYQWYMLLGRLGLGEMPEVQLEKYQEHLQAQKTAKDHDSQK